MSDVYDFSLKAIDGTDLSLDDYRGKVLLLVNVASQCGLTPQYEGLQKLHAEYSPRGFAVLGFPYGVTFPLSSKIEVNGGGRAPLYGWLTGQPTEPDGPGDIKWNFAKFVVDRAGSVVARFDPSTAPTAPELRAAIQDALGR